MEYLGRFKSKRRKRREILTNRDKHIIQVSKRIDEIWDIIRNEPLVPLDKPYQKGFVRSFVLRDDVALRYDSELIQSILDTINTELYSYNKKFNHKVKIKGKRKKVLETRKQYLQSISLYDWTHKKPYIDFTDKQKSYFYLAEHRNKYSGNIEHVYVFNQPYMFVLKVYPNMIIHYKPVDLELISEKKLLNNYLDKNALWGKLSHLTRGGTNKFAHSEDNHPKYYIKNYRKSVNYFLGNNDEIEHINSWDGWDS